MSKKIRYGDFVSGISVKYRKISYNDITPKQATDDTGVDIPYCPSDLNLRRVDVYRLLEPYVSARFIGQLKAVAPLALYLAFFQTIILHENLSEPWMILTGFLSVITGLALFLEGVKVGLMPFGEMIGDALPSKRSLPVVLLTAFSLGILVNFAEPAIGALKAAGAIISPEKSPYMYLLLNGRSWELVLAIGAGVGSAAVIGTLRFLYGWSLKPIIFLAMVPALALTGILMSDPKLKDVIGLAWDCGAVTTGPVTVPIILALGIGVAASSGRGDSSLSGFGVVTLASVFPVIAVMSLTIHLAGADDAAIAAEVARNVASMKSAGDSFFSATPQSEIIAGAQAVIPLAGFLFLLMKYVVKEEIPRKNIIVYGVVISVLGMVLFNIGLTCGLARLGAQSGGLVPAAFIKMPSVAGSPIYSYFMGLLISFSFAGLLGFGATLAEPALAAMGVTVENLTNGAYKKSTLIYSVSAGVGVGLALGTVKIIFSLPLGGLLLALYTITLILTALSTEEFVNVAWDSAAVTTGPVTVPLVLAMGLGFSGALGTGEGFGVLAMASVCPIISVLATGIWVRFKVRQSHLAIESKG